MLEALKRIQEKRKPIVVSNPNDPRLKAYQDSLGLYNSTDAAKKFLNQTPMFNLDKEKQLGKINPDKKNNISSIGSIFYDDKADIYNYKKPEQPVILARPLPILPPDINRPATVNGKQVGTWNMKLASLPPQKPTYQQFLKTANQDYIGPDYNLEDAYKELPLKVMQAWAKDPEKNHLPDTYKLPNHPTFSNESKYYRQGMKAGRWEGDNFVPIPAVAPLPIKMVPTNIAPVLQPNPTPIPVAAPMAIPPRGKDSIWGPGERYSLKDEKVRQMLKVIQKLKK